MFPESDKKFMKLAVAEARKAPFPFGCVLVRDGRVLSRGQSGETTDFDPTAHAEVNAIRAACRILKTKDLRGSTIYTTAEPCPMCFTAAWWAHVSRVVFGITLEESSKLFGREILVPASYLNKRGGQIIELRGSVLKSEVLEMLERT